MSVVRTRGADALHAEVAHGSDLVAGGPSPAPRRLPIVYQSERKPGQLSTTEIASQRRIRLNTPRGCRAHNPKVAGSNPAAAIEEAPLGVSDGPLGRG